MLPWTPEAQIWSKRCRSLMCRECAATSRRPSIHDRAVPQQLRWSKPPRIAPLPKWLEMRQLPVALRSSSLLPMVSARTWIQKFRKSNSIASVLYLVSHLQSWCIVSTFIWHPSRHCLKMRRSTFKKSSEPFHSAIRSTRFEPLNEQEINTHTVLVSPQ